MLFGDVQAPSKPYCDICGAAIDNIDIHEVYIEEKRLQLARFVTAIQL